jgi:hypothetical protein
MKEPRNKRRAPIIDVILVLLIIGLIFVLYTLVGGNLTVNDISGGSDPFGDIMANLNSIGKGIGRMFGNVTP